MIYHGDIVINSDAKIGNYYSLHGNNCIGNKRTVNVACPTIGDNVNIGWGGVIIGDVLIGNNVTIGASTFVNNDTPDDSTIYNQKQIIVKKIN